MALRASTASVGRTDWLVSNIYITEECKAPACGADKPLLVLLLHIGSGDDASQQSGHKVHPQRRQ